MKKTTLFALGLSFVIAVACNKKTDDEAATESSGDGATSDLIQSSVGVVGDALASGDAALMAADGELNAMACSFGGFSSCTTSGTDGIKTKSWGSCTMGSDNSVTLDGTITHTFSNNTSCTMGVGNSFTRSLSGHVATLASGFKIISYTGPETGLGGKDIGMADIQDYTGENRFGGVTVLNTGSGNRTIIINGIHRRGIRTDGNYGFWHTTYTSTPITANLSGTQYTIASGTVNTAFNRLRKTAATSFSNVVYDPSVGCCYPISGSISISIDSGTAVTTTFTSTCGSVTIDGTASTLPACGGGSGQ